MYRMEILCWFFRLWMFFRIVVCRFVFIMEIGLFVIRSLGLSISVWVMISCCCWLLESWCG